MILAKKLIKMVSYAVWIGLGLFILGLILLIIAFVIYENSFTNNNGSTTTFVTGQGVPTTVWVLGGLGVLFMLIGIGLIIYGYIDTDQIISDPSYTVDNNYLTVTSKVPMSEVTRVVNLNNAGKLTGENRVIAGVDTIDITSY